MNFKDYGIIVSFDSSKGFGVAKTVYYGEVIIYKDKNIVKEGYFVLIGEIIRNTVKNRNEGITTTLFTDLNSFCEEIFQHWKSKLQLVYDADIKWLLDHCSEEFLKKIINTNKNNWFNDLQFIAQLREKRYRFYEYKVISDIDIVCDFFLELWLEKGNNKYNYNLKWLIGINDICIVILEKVLAYDYSWIYDNNFTYDYKSSSLQIDTVCNFLINKNKFKNGIFYNEDIKWIINHGNVSILAKLLEYKPLYLNEQFVNDLKEVQSRYDTNIINQFLFELWIMKSEFKYDENIKWILNNGNDSILVKLLECKSLYLNEQFVNDLKEVQSRYDSSIISNYIFELWEFKCEFKYDENIEWILHYGTSFILKQVIDKNFNYLANDAEFIRRVRKIFNPFVGCFDSDNNYLEDNSVPELIVSKDKILILSSFIYKVWSSQVNKEYDENVKWLIHNCDEDTLIKLIDLNRQKWLINKDFIYEIKEKRLNLNYDFKEEFLYDVCLKSEKFKYNENIKWLLLNGKLDSIKKILINNFGYSESVLDKIYSALFSLKNTDYISQNASEIELIKDLKQKTKNKFSKLFIQEFEVSEKSLIRRSSIKKETHAATDLANFVFCPASYVLNQTFYIDIQEQENVFVGTQEHERQRLLNLSNLEGLRYIKPDREIPDMFKRIFNANRISQGHNDLQKIIYYTKKNKLSGIPDYIFQDDKCYFAVEEKYTFKKYEDLTNIYDSHKIQALVYLYLWGLNDSKEFQPNEVYVIYWFLKKDYQSDICYVDNYRIFQFCKSKKIDEIILGVYNNLESIQERKPYPFSPNKIDYRKCVKCSYSPYCEYKKGGNSIIKLEPLDSSIIKEDIDLNVI